MLGGRLKFLTFVIMMDFVSISLKLTRNFLNVWQQMRGDKVQSRFLLDAKMFKICKTLTGE